MNFPDKLDVLTVHSMLIAHTGGTNGIRDEALLESALAAPENRFRYEAADVVTCAATYAYHLTQAHAFVDGNKRLGAAIAEAFLETNGFELVMTNAEIVNVFVAIASGEISRDEVEQRFRERVQPKSYSPPDS